MKITIEIPDHLICLVSEILEASQLPDDDGLTAARLMSKYAEVTGREDTVEDFLEAEKIVSSIKRRIKLRNLFRNLVYRSN